MGKYKVLFCIGLFFLLFGCTEDTDDAKNHQASGKGTVRFTLTPLMTSVEEGPLSRSTADSPATIKQLWCVVYDAKGNVLRTFHLSGAETAQLYLEGIEPGNYTSYFMATTEDISLDTTFPEDVTQPWISHQETGTPYQKDYLYKKLDFTVSPDHTNQTIEVKLPRLTGRVEVRLDFSNSQLEQLIQKVEIFFDEEAKVSNYMLGDGTYGGEDTLGPMDITDEKTFFSLPGKGLSGTVRVTQKVSLSDTETSVVDYRFDYLDITPGFISTIRIPYSHSEESYGEIKVLESSYTADNSDLMFKDDEPASMILTRTFKVNQPLQITIDTPNKKLVVKFFAPVELKDTRIWIKFKKYSSKFFLFAHYDAIHPFQVSKIDIPVMSRQCKFIAEDGEQIWIPAQEDLSMSNCELKIEYSDSPYIQKIKTIKSKWTVGFQEAFWDSQLPREDMTPQIARHICVIAVNIAYMFSLDQFRLELENLNLYDDNKFTINKENLMRNLHNKESFSFGILQHNPFAQGLADVGGKKLAVYKEFYAHFNAEQLDEGGATSFFHEFGHCLGYSHKSNMTADEDYGRSSVWPDFCVSKFKGLLHELPYNEDVSHLPR